MNKLLKQVRDRGEPWITGWHQEDLAAFLAENGGFQVASEIGLLELNEKYFTPAGRAVPPDMMYTLERLVVADTATDAP